MISDDKKTILVIDDDITIRKVISHHLKSNKYSVLEASGPEEATTTLKNQNVDLVLCDVTMGEIDGFTFCEQVRENENHRLLPFVFVTAKNTAEDKLRALEAGGDDLITKPFDVNDLLLKVRALLRKSDIYNVYGVKKNIKESFETHKVKILLVDDDESMSLLFKYNLERAGFDCVAAFNVPDAINILKSDIPDIIISDIMMPKIDGFAFRRMLLERDEFRSIPFIFLTAKGEEEDILEGYELGITDYVVKTAGPKVVVAKVSAIIKSLDKERQKVVNELQEAANSLRVKVVPDSLPTFGNYKINHWHVPYHGIPGGDFLDYYQLDEDHLAIILGDVMGKKWGAWYFAFAYAGYIRSALRSVLQNFEEFSPAKILEKVNATVYKDAKVSEVFTTLSILIINVKDSKIIYSGAGDLPLIHYKKNMTEISKIKSKGILLGFSDKVNYEDISVELEKDDIILMLTDGIIEAHNKNGEQFGDQNLYSSLMSLNGTDNILEKFKEDFNSFTSKQYSDDISLISIIKK